MGPVFYVLAIMGCGDDQSACVAARVEPAQFATAAQCQAALPAALARNTDLDYPVISGACQASGMQMTAADAPAPRG